ncbi:hypothetical protein D3C83_84370 [compost metagenome]
MRPSKASASPAGTRQATPANGLSVHVANVSYSGYDIGTEKPDWTLLRPENGPWGGSKTTSSAGRSIGSGRQ